MFLLMTAGMMASCNRGQCTTGKECSWRPSSPLVCEALAQLSVCVWAEGVIQRLYNLLHVLCSDPVSFRILALLMKLIAYM